MSCPYPRSSTTSDGHAGQHSDAPEECRNSGSRGTVCVNCSRPGLWGGRVGNHRLYPEADRLQLRLRCAPPTLPAAAHRQRSGAPFNGATDCSCKEPYMDNGMRTMQRASGGGTSWGLKPVKKRAASASYTWLKIGRASCRERV